MVYTVTDLAEGNEYEFRVIAENAAGMSKPSQPTSPIKAVDPYSESFVCLFLTIVVVNVVVTVSQREKILNIQLNSKLFTI